MVDLVFFKIEEFACRHCGQALMDEWFLKKLDKLRERVGFPLVVSSGYRCPAHNAKVSKTGLTGPHTTGHAVDFLLSHFKAFKVISVAPLMGFTGIGVNQKGSSRFIHLDDLPNGPGQPRPHVWSY